MAVAAISGPVLAGFGVYRWLEINKENCLANMMRGKNFKKLL